ncbi:helix-turn-helix domain-containing protein [Paenibacillus wuxiensis]|uniref:helix-turn-helix domain-containing protein n=1 Tax=Paenibacillaceae bacterium P-4 TaxID=3160969 RepID=UPI00406B9ACA
MDATIIKTIGELVQNTRRSLNMTITQLSELSGVPRATISRIENGEVKRPEFSSVRPLAVTLNIPFETLVDYYVEVEKRAESLLHILQSTIRQESSTELIRKVATKYLESPNEDSFDLTERLYQHIDSIEDTSIKLSLYNLIVEHSRSHGIMPYIAKGMYRCYLIERNDFSKLKETYSHGKYVLHYIDFLSQQEQIELYYKLGVHAFNLKFYKESIHHCKKILAEDSNASHHKVNALGILIEAYFCIGEYEESEFYCLQYKQFNYPNVQENVVLAEALIKAKKGNTDLAIEQLLTFLKTCSDLSALPATKNLLQLYLQQNNLKDAKTLLENSKIDSTILDKGNPFIFSGYADYLRIKGEYYLALGNYETCVTYMVEAALNYSKVNDTTKEKECLNTVVRIHLEHSVSPQSTFEKLNTYFIQSSKELED